MAKPKHPLPLNRTAVVALSFIWLTLSIDAGAQCPSPCTRQGSAFVSDQARLGISFNAVGNAAEADGHYASAEMELAAYSRTETQYLVATGFGFNIPDHAVITQVQVDIHKRASAIGTETAVKDDEVRLVKQGIITGANKAAQTTWSIRDYVESYIGDANDWEAALTGKDVNDPGFGVAISAQLSSGGAPILLRAQVDQVRMSVTYTVPAPLTVTDFTTALQSATVACKWMLEKEQPGTRMVLQQSTDQKTWKDLRAYNLASNAANTSYRHSELVSNPGTYFFRIKLIAPDNTVTYSRISSVRFGAGGLKLYPTAARSMVYLENVDTRTKVEVYDLNSQLIPTTTVVIKDRMLAVRVNHLPKGMYIVRVGQETRKFVKE